LRTVFINLAVLAVAIALMELVLQIIDYPRSMEYGSPSPYNNSVTRDQPHNQLGYRGRAIAYSSDDFVILLLGDSQVENTGERRDYTKTPEAILEGRLAESGAHSTCLAKRKKKQFRVFTVAWPGWGQDQELLALQKYFASYRADLVVLWETPENDMWNNGFPTHIPLNGSPKPTFIIAQDGSARLVDRSQIIPFWMDLKIGILMYQVLQGLSKPGHPMQALLWNPDIDWDKYLPPPLHVVTDTHVEDSTKYLSTINPYILKDIVYIEKSHFALGMNDGSPRLDWMARLTNLLTRKIRDVSTQAGADFIAFNFTASGTDQPLYPIPGIYKINGDRFIYSDIAAARRLAVINQGIEHYAIDLKLPRWRKRDSDPHLNMAGNEEILGKLASIVEKRCAARPAG